MSIRGSSVIEVGLKLAARLCLVPGKEVAVQVLACRYVRMTHVRGERLSRNVCRDEQACERVAALVKRDRSQATPFPSTERPIAHRSGRERPRLGGAEDQSHPSAGGDPVLHKQA